MADYPYNPFSKPLQDIAGNDLRVLRSTAEYIEYKRELPNLRDLAKALSAFANQYGGFLFIGVTEAGDGSRMAKEFGGLPEQEVNH
jgi:predicted HTH transcriptional regulator